jgi:hypothetical protein
MVVSSVVENFNKLSALECSSSTFRVLNSFHSILSDYPQARHARREAGIQQHGWQA